MIGELLTGVVWLWCLALACFVLAPFTPAGRRRTDGAEQPLPVPVPRDPAGWGWISDAERQRFEAIEAAETTGGGER